MLPHVASRSKLVSERGSDDAVDARRTVAAGCGRSYPSRPTPCPLLVEALADGVSTRGWSWQSRSKASAST